MRRGAGSSWVRSSRCSSWSGRRVEAKLETRVTFDLSRLWAHDLAGRASSFKAMITGGMDIERAAALSGLVALCD